MWERVSIFLRQRNKRQITSITIHHVNGTLDIEYPRSMLLPSNAMYSVHCIPSCYFRRSYQTKARLMMPRRVSVTPEKLLLCLWKSDTDNDCRELTYIKNSGRQAILLLKRNASIYGFRGSEECFPRGCDSVILLGTFYWISE